MTCSHCGTDHKVEAKSWPDSWDADRRMCFTKSMLLVGVKEEYTPAMAAEIEKLSKTSPYIVSEVELVAYMLQSAIVSKEINKVSAMRERWLAWSRSITRPLTFKVADSRTSFVCKMAILVVIGLPMLLLTAPIRTFFSLYKWLVCWDFHPYFTEWLKKNGVEK